jgi:hypothetical protein
MAAAHVRRWCALTNAAGGPEAGPRHGGPGSTDGTVDPTGSVGRAGAGGINGASLASSTGGINGASLASSTGGADGVSLASSTGGADGVSPAKQNWRDRWNQPGRRKRRSWRERRDRRGRPDRERGLSFGFSYGTPVTVLTYR